MSEQRQNMNIIQVPKMTKYPPILTYVTDTSLLIMTKLQSSISSSSGCIKMHIEAPLLLIQRNNPVL